MAKHSIDRETYSDSGNWNIAQQYAYNMILKPLMLINEYKTIATFGTSDLINEFEVPEEVKTVAKISAIKRMHNTMEDVVSGCKFALKKDDVEFMEKIGVALKQIEPDLVTISKSVQKTNATGSSQHIVIIELNFNKVFNMLKRLHEAMLHPMNRAELIFRASDRSDFSTWKADIKRSVVEQG